MIRSVRFLPQARTFHRLVRLLTTKRQQHEALKNGTLVTTSEPSKLVKTDLVAHLQWIERNKPSYEKNQEPPLFPDPSGVVNVDLTDAMFDLKDMYDPRIHLANAPDWDKDGYEATTPLSDDLIALIGATGRTMTVAEYMRQALTHPLYGYYTCPERKDDWEDLDSVFDEPVTPSNYIIGAKGDFVTAPEISQIFGESIAVWFMIQWQTIGKPTDIQIVEIGPGKGTLICDVIKTSMKSFKDHCGASLRMIHLVETSPAMREEQRRKLEELDLDLDATIVFEDQASSKSENAPPNVPKKDSKQVIRVQWHDSFASVKANAPKMPTFIVCQELIDALPIHAFEKTIDGWRERMIDVAAKSDEDDEELQKPQQAEVKKTADTTTDIKLKEKLPRLRIVIAPDVTPGVTTLLNVDKDGKIEGDDSSEIGSVIEVCPEGILLVQDIHKFIEHNRGAALIIDYGEEGSSDSIRGFSKHKQVSFLSRPGEVDVTADVDFTALKHAVNSRRGAEDSSDNSPFAFGPIEQGKFLVSMGATERAMHIIDDDKTTDEHAAEIHDALERLISPEYMGHRYKVLAIARKKDGIFEPAAF